MKLPISWTITTALLVLTLESSSNLSQARSSVPITPIAIELTTGTESTKWIVDRADNICGLDDAKMLSKPAKVDYDTLIKATAEMKKIRDDKIDSGSPEGIRLRQAAVDRVRAAAEKVRVAEGYCSVWKQVRHVDGRTIPDITDLVKAQL